MGTPVPRSALFNFEMEAHKADGITVDGDLSDWPDACELPPVWLEGDEPFARMWLAWSTEGLWFACRVQRTRAPRVIPKKPWDGDCVEFCVDTRDVKTAHRAGRYCHRFVMAPVGGPGRAALPFFVHLPIHRSLMDPPIVKQDMIEIASKVADDHYIIEAYFPSASMSGYDAIDDSHRLGIACVVHDVDRGEMNWPHSQILPVGMDPSLWASMKLV
jgi:hypothetical protein